MSQQQTRCIHADTPYNDPAVSCGRPVFRRSHGFLCLDHYRTQQMGIPVPPRKPFSVWGYKRPMNDDQVSQDIVDTDRRVIAAGVVTRMRFGSLDPVYLRVLRPVGA